MEEEGELMMDHDYDGIKELDNVLPPWWVYLFYACIAFAFIYLIKFHVLGHDDQKAEYEKEMSEAKIAVEEYKKTAPDLMDKEKVTLLTDGASLAAGKAIFETNCVACHRADGGGGIGPNLTDDHWILGGGIKNGKTTKTTPIIPTKSSVKITLIPNNSLFTIAKAVNPRIKMAE